MILADSAHTNI